MPDYLLGGPKIPYPWEMNFGTGIMDAMSKLFPSAPSPAPATGGQTVESYQFPFTQLTPESMKLGKNAPPVENPLVPPPTPGVNLVTPPAAPAPKSPVELARAEAESLYQKHIKGGKAPTEFGLPWDFFTKHGDISGGVFVGPQGPKFLFNENKPQSMMDTFMPVIQRYAEQMAKIQSGNMNPEEAGKMFATMPNAEQLGAFASLMGAQTTAGKAPSEISFNMSRALMPHVVPNVYAGGPGEMASLLIPPFGGVPRTLATGMQAEHGQGVTGLINQGYIEFMKESAKIDQDVLMQPEQKVAAHAALQNRFRDYASGIQQMLGANRAPGKAATPGASPKPSWAQWYAEARKSNPKEITDAQLTEYYQQNYGR